MFERFTREAREVVVLATEEAKDRRDEHIGTEHLLIGLACHGVGREAMQRLGIDASALREALDQLDVAALQSLGLDRPGAGRYQPRRRNHLPFTGGAKECLTETLRLAISRGDRHIGPDHIGLVLASRGPRDQATLLLEAAGVQPADLRRQLDHPNGRSD